MHLFLIEKSVPESSLSFLCYKQSRKEQDRLSFDFISSNNVFVVHGKYIVHVQCSFGKLSSHAVFKLGPTSKVHSYFVSLANDQ